MIRRRYLTIKRRQPGSEGDGWTESTNTANVLSEIYRITVPRGRVWQIDPTRLVHFRLATSESWKPTGSGTQVFEATYSVARVYNPANEAESDGVWQRVYLNSNDTEMEIDSVNDDEDSGADTITVKGVTANTEYTVYYVVGSGTSGHVEVGVEEPKGLGKLYYPFFSADTRTFNKIAQLRRGVGFYWACPFPIPEKFDIVVYLKAAWTIAWETPANGDELPVTVMEIPIIEANREDFPRTLESGIRARMATLAR